MLTGFSCQQITTVWHLARGYSDQQIAEAMGLPLTTIKSRINQILTWLDLQNRTQLALLAIRAGIVELDQIHIRAAFHVAPQEGQTNGTTTTRTAQH